jgi:hypothetical protein
MFGALAALRNPWLVAKQNTTINGTMVTFYEKVDNLLLFRFIELGLWQCSLYQKTDYTILYFYFFLYVIRLKLIKGRKC